MNLHQLKTKIQTTPGVKHVEFDYLDQIIFWIKMDITNYEDNKIDQIIKLLGNYKYVITATFSNYKTK